MIICTVTKRCPYTVNHKNTTTKHSNRQKKHLNWPNNDKEDYTQSNNITSYLSRK